MVKKLFALASVSALAGLISAVSAAGCTTTTEEGGGGTADAATDTKKPDAKPVVPGDNEEPVVEQCWKDDALDVSDFEYKPARVQTGSCTEAVFKVISDLVESNDKATWDDLQTAIKDGESEACATCIFGGIADDKWAPVIGEGDGKNQVNYGGCIEVVSGNTACGKAFGAWNACLDTACADCDTDTASDCASGVQETACKDATEALGTACGKDVNTYIKACNKTGEASIAGPIRKQCIATGVKDAGPG